MRPISRCPEVQDDSMSVADETNKDPLFGEMRRFYFKTENENEKESLRQLVADKGLSRKDLMEILSVLGLKSRI